MNWIASNELWVPICAIALGLIVWDLKYPRNRRFVLALAVAVSLAFVVGLRAAEIVDPCTTEPIVSMSWWLRAFMGCW
jgi:hypothetical protein